MTKLEKEVYSTIYKELMRELKDVDYEDDSLEEDFPGVNFEYNLGKKIGEAVLEATFDVAKDLAFTKRIYISLLQGITDVVDNHKKEIYWK